MRRERRVRVQGREENFGLGPQNEKSVKLEKTLSFVLLKPVCYGGQIGWDKSG